MAERYAQLRPSGNERFLGHHKRWVKLFGLPRATPREHPGAHLGRMVTPLPCKPHRLYKSKVKRGPSASDAIAV